MTKAKRTTNAKPAPAAATPTAFHDRNLAATSPAKEQFEPTPAAPVRQRYRMAGGSA